MSKVRVTKIFRFEMAHALLGYDGLCKNIHGHSYILKVTVSGEPITDPDNIKEGMVIDFGDLKSIVNQEIIHPLDHAIILNTKAFESLGNFDSQMFKKQYIVDYQPTCENMVVDFAEKLLKKLPENLHLHSLKLHETATSFAEWYASDN